MVTAAGSATYLLKRRRTTACSDSVLLRTVDVPCVNPRVAVSSLGNVSKMDCDMVAPIVALTMPGLACMHQLLA